ncbi:hypothetical protein MMC17_003279 [Xylographa soralifera]|nr:hypothetical protein [Xylographa soralifera]
MNPGQMAVALNAYSDNKSEGEAELLALMRIDLAISASLPGSYEGVWAWYPSLDHFACSVEVLIPEDIKGYHEWVARGALTYIRHYPTEIQQLQDKLADIAAGGEASYPELTIPTRQTYGDTDLLREIVEQIIGTETPSLLEALHAAEMVIQNYKSQLRALCLQIISATSGPGPTLEAQMSTLIIRNTPDEIDNLMRGIGRLYLTE